MAHWIIDDRGFGGLFYSCSNCKSMFSDLDRDDPGMWDKCEYCGAELDEDAVYTDDIRPVKGTKNKKNKPHKTTMADRLKAALRALRGKPAMSVQFGIGIDVKHCSECEYKQERERKVVYLCDRKRCNNCTDDWWCEHTTDIRHAKNFMYVDSADAYMEKTLDENEQED